jgi:hypothetical protein
LLIECRSISDPLATQGDIISPTERVHGHYRRFIIREQLVHDLTEAGLTMESAIERKGLAVYRDEDPIVIRVVAVKPR